MTETILNRIRAHKWQEIAAAKAALPWAQLEPRARAAPPVRGFAAALRKASQQGYGLIAEIKKASPSRGVIRSDFDPPALAQAYARGGATCLSVLTDSGYFQGANAYLTQARAAVQLPVLRKDFFYDPYQVIEARALGADCILIIMAAVGDAQAQELEHTAHAWGMEVLLEVHNHQEMERACAMRSALLGINNRDLHTFATSLDTTRQLAPLVPCDRLTISESGVRAPADLAELARYGVRNFLIGEHLMRQTDVAAATATLLARPLDRPDRPDR